MVTASTQALGCLGGVYRCCLPHHCLANGPRNGAPLFLSCCVLNFGDQPKVLGAAPDVPCAAVDRVGRGDSDRIVLGSANVIGQPSDPLLANPVADQPGQRLAADPRSEGAVGHWFGPVHYRRGGLPVAGTIGNEVVAVSQVQERELMRPVSSSGTWATSGVPVRGRHPGRGGLVAS